MTIARFSSCPSENCISIEYVPDCKLGIIIVQLFSSRATSFVSIVTPKRFIIFINFGFPSQEILIIFFAGFGNTCNEELTLFDDLIRRIETSLLEIEKNVGVITPTLVCEFSIRIRKRSPTRLTGTAQSKNSGPAGISFAMKVHFAARPSQSRIFSASPIEIFLFF